MQIVDKLENNKIVYKTATKEEESLIKIADLKKNLADTDYQAIKYAEGLISDGEYKAIKEQRQAWRDEINELEKEMK